MLTSSQGIPLISKKKIDILN